MNLRKGLGLVPVPLVQLIALFDDLLLLLHLVIRVPSIQTHTALVGVRVDLLLLSRLPKHPRTRGPLVQVVILGDLQLLLHLLFGLDWLRSSEAHAALIRVSVLLHLGLGLELV